MKKRTFMKESRCLFDLIPIKIIYYLQLFVDSNLKDTPISSQPSKINKT